MSKFTKTNVKTEITYPATGLVLRINRYVKKGTKRVFFAPTVIIEGKEYRLNTTMYAYMSEAERVGKHYAAAYAKKKQAQ